MLVLYHHHDAVSRSIFSLKTIFLDNHELGCLSYPQPHSRLVRGLGAALLMPTLRTRKPRQPTLKQRLFVQHYTDPSNPSTFGNASAAGRLAYPNQTPRSAAIQGQENLQNPIIQQAIEDRIMGVEEGKEKFTEWARTLATNGDLDAAGRMLERLFRFTGDWKDRSEVLQKADVQDAVRRLLVGDPAKVEGRN